MACPAVALEAGATEAGAQHARHSPAEGSGIYACCLLASSKSTATYHTGLQTSSGRSVSLGAGSAAVGTSCRANCVLCGHLLTGRTATAATASKDGYAWLTAKRS